MSTTPASAANPNVFDASGLTALKRQVQSNDPKALKAAAQQFEALFLQIVLKSMRDATPREGIFDSEQSKMYESLLDQQMAQVIGAKGKGLGLAAMLEKQMLQQREEPQLFEGGLPLLPRQKNGEGGLPLPVDALPGLLRTAPRLPAGSALSAPSGDGTASAREFVNRLWPAAVDSARATGIPPQFMLAQAALETGWGKSEPRRADGSPSYNVFGIKAGRNWQGPVVEATTTEYVDGVAQKQVERFRAYGSYAEAFRDYAGVLTSNPRYAAIVSARDAATFANGLQKAGYATDPAYAGKLQRIIGGDTLRQALIG